MILLLLLILILPSVFFLSASNSDTAPGRLVPRPELYWGLRSSLSRRFFCGGISCQSARRSTGLATAPALALGWALALALALGWARALALALGLAPALALEVGLAPARALDLGLALAQALALAPALLALELGWA